MGFRSSKKSMRKRSIKDMIQFLRYHLLGLDEEDDFKLTGEMVRIWCSHGLSLLTGLIAGYGTYWYCELDMIKYHEMRALYQTNGWTAPPGEMHFVLSMIWCYVVCAVLSLVFCGMCQLVIGVCFTSNLHSRKEVRLLSMSLAFCAYVLIIFVCCVFGVPVPYV